MGYYILHIHNVICWLFLLSANFFSRIMVSKNSLWNIPWECQAFWIQIRPDILFGVIWLSKQFANVKVISRWHLAYKEIIRNKKNTNYETITEAKFIYKQLIQSCLLVKRMTTISYSRKKVRILKPYYRDKICFSCKLTLIRSWGQELLKNLCAKPELDDKNWVQSLN